MTRAERLQKRVNAEFEKMQVTAQKNPAVAECARAFMLAYAEAGLAGKSETTAKNRGRRAYVLTMPPLAGDRNIRNFIACTAHAALLDIFETEEASKFLYAAQVAHTARRIKKKSSKNPHKPSVSRVNAPLANPENEGQTSQTTPVIDTV